MKRILMLAAIFFCVSFLSAQPCVTDVWMCLQQDQVGKAKKLIDECMVGNEDKAEAWLMKGNVYLRRYENEKKRREKDAKYVIKDPDAIFIANESFFKAVELDPKVETKPGMFDAIQGQILCAGPLYTMGQEAKKAQKWDDAFRYLSLAAKNFKLDKSNPNLAQDLGYIYFDLAQISQSLNNSENYEKMLKEGVTVKTPVPEIYLLLYDLYKSKSDTVNCKKILSTAKKNVPEASAIDVYAAEIEFLAWTNEIDKMNKAADKLLAKHENNPAVMSLVAEYLINSNQFLKADSIITKGLEIDSNNFNFNRQMGARFYFESLSLEPLIESATKNKEWTKLTEYRDAQKPLLEKSHDWVEKAYNINKDDRENNIMLKQLKVKLRKQVPAELDEKVNSYYK